MSDLDPKRLFDLLLTEHTIVGPLRFGRILARLDRADLAVCGKATIDLHRKIIPGRHTLITVVENAFGVAGDEVFHHELGQSSGVSRCADLVDHDPKLTLFLSKPADGFKEILPELL